MNPEDRGSGVFSLRDIPRVGLFGFAATLLVTLLAWFATRTMGPMGLVMISAGLVGAIITIYMLIRYPIVICVAWFFAMSGMQTLGMIRMPGLPDFSIARLFLVLVVILMPLGIIAGRTLLRPPFTPDLFIVLHAFYVLLNIYFISGAPKINMWIASSLTPVIGYLFAKQYVNQDRHLKVIFAFFTLVSVYFWVTAVAEHFGWDFLVWPKAILDRDIGHSWFGRARGPFLQPALTGQILGWYMMVQVFLLTRRISLGWKVLIALNIGLGAVGVLFTYTRGVWLATAMGFLAMAVLRPGYRKILVFTMIGVVLLSALGLLNAQSDEFLAERLETTNTIDNRLGFFAAATRMIQDKPLFGVGFFRYLELAPDYNKGTNVPLYGFVKKGAGEHVAIHDIYIGRAAEEGLVSLGLFLTVLFLLFREYVRRWNQLGESTDKRRWFDRDFVALAAGLGVSYLVNGMIIDYRYFDLINVLPWFFSGIIIAFPAYERRAGDVPAVRSDHAPPVQRMP